MEKYSVREFLNYREKHEAEVAERLKGYDDKSESIRVREGSKELSNEERNKIRREVNKYYRMKSTYHEYMGIAEEEGYRERQNSKYKGKGKEDDSYKEGMEKIEFEGIGYKRDENDTRDLKERLKNPRV